MFISDGEISISIHRPPCNPIPENTKYVCILDKDPKQHSPVEIWNHIPIILGGYISIKQITTYEKLKATTGDV